MTSELRAERRGTTIVLLSPGVGLFTCARAAGDLVAGGAEAGVLLTLGRATRLVVPPGVEGRVVNPPPTLVRQPVSWGDPLYEIEAIEAARSGAALTTPAAAGAAAADDEDTRRVFRSPRSGRFYLRPSPAEAPFVVPGAILEAGQSVGLIEVMKTFAHVRYEPVGGLPSPARVSRILVEDGAEIGAGEPLLELEPAPQP